MYFRSSEWHRKKTIWLAWPYDKALWAENLLAAQEEFRALLEALKEQSLLLLFPDHKTLNTEARYLAHYANISSRVMAYGDIWLRDTLPIMVNDERGHSLALIFRFNGWGGKYVFDADMDLNKRVAQALKMPVLMSELVCEGGALECDGEGTLLTTEQCLLNPNRNRGLSKEEIEAELGRVIGAKKIIWLKNGLKNDHTDGHIDTLARFIAPACVAIMRPCDRDDPNYDALMAIKEELSTATDACGRKLSLIELPSVGAVYDSQGALMPASYLNFIIADTSIIMPTYGSVYDQKALQALQAHALVPVKSLSARAILSGGGAFHCLSQEYFIY